MDKEEYAELHYLLAKLKYTCAEMINNISMLEIDDMIKKINDVQRILIVDGKDNQTLFRVGDGKNENNNV